jgi:adenylate cyclase, class 2
MTKRFIITYLRKGLIFLLAADDADFADLTLIFLKKYCKKISVKSAKSASSAVKNFYTMGHLNVEIKAKCRNHAVIEQILLERNARFIGLDHQIDTYFKVPNGRLKLREGNIENTLIFYDRPNQAGPKKSDIILYHVQPDASLKAILEKTNGVLAVVDKHRKIFFIDNVKFHLDEVVGLGQFVEIEAIDTEVGLGYDFLLEQCSFFMGLFDIQESDLLTHSYSDMVLEK